MSKNRIFALIAALALTLGIVGCNNRKSDTELVTTNAALVDTGTATTTTGAVIVTTNALFEIVSAIGGDEIEVTSLLSGGEEIHHFEPTARDAEALADAELIIYNGLGLDDWAVELSGKTEAFAVTSEMSGLLDGDPHVWLSPKSATTMANEICRKLTELYPESANVFEQNNAAFCLELRALSDEFAPSLENARLDTFVTGHAALGYLAAEFGLTQKSVADVFSSGEPTPKQLMELADFCNGNGVKYVLSESAAPLAVSETLANECGAEVVPVYTMESVEDGLSFLARMRHNLETVLKAVT